MVNQTFAGFRVNVDIAGDVTGSPSTSTLFRHIERT